MVKVVDMLKKGITGAFVLFILSSACVFAADDEKALHEKAAAQLIDSMPDFFRDVVALQKMTPEQKIDYILTQSEGRIKEKIAEKFQEDMQEKLTKYAQEAIRAKAFTDIAMPKIRNAYATGTAFNWGSIDAEIGSSVDTKMRAFGAALSTAKIGWDAYEAYGKGGSLEAFKSVSGAVYDLLAEAFIPGWGYFKLGKEMVEVLGRYVLDYATDTAVEGMLNDMYSMKSNPQGLAEWLINKSPSDIQKDLDSKWDDGMGFGRLWEGQGTDKGDQAMKERISSTLISLRGELLVRQKEEERKQKELTDKLNEYMDKARTAQAESRAVAQKARDAVKVELEKIREFRYKLTGIDQQVAEQRYEETQDAFQADKSKVKDGQPYQPINRAPILEALEEILSQIHEDGRGGYDQEATRVAMEEYKKIRQELVEKAAVDNGFAGYRWPDTKWGKDVAALTAQENTLRQEAKERLLKRYEAMRAAVEKLKSQIEEASRLQYKATLELNEEIANSLHDGNNWRGSPETAYDHTRRPQVFSQPGDVVGELEGLRKFEKELTEDEAALGALHAKEKKIFADFVSAMQSVREEFVKAIPENLFESEKPEGSWNVSEKLSVKRFYQDQVIVDYKELFVETVSIPSMGGMPFAEYETKVLNVRPGEVIQAHRKTLGQRIAFLESIADEDAMALGFMALYNRVMGVKVLEETSSRDLEQEKKYLQEVFNTRDGMSGQFMHVELTKGFTYREELQKAWEENRIAIEKLESLMKAMGKRVKYSFDLQGAMYPKVSNWALLPEKLKIVDEEYQKSLEITTTRLGLSDKYLGEWKATVARLESEPGNAQYRAQEFEKIVKFVRNQVGLLKSWGPHQDVLDRLKNATDFQEEIGKKLEKAKADHQKFEDNLRRDSAARQAAYEAEQRRLKEEAARKAEEEKKRAETPAVVVYHLIDPSINSVSLRTASGEVVVSRSDLKGGALQITAQLDTLESVSSLMASEDGGAWKKLPKRQAVTFSFAPAVGKTYAPILRINTVDGRTVDLPFFANVTGIVYKDVDHVQMTASAIGALSEAYERMDARGFGDLISRDYLGNKSTLEEGVRFDFEIFTDIRLKIYIDRIERRGDQFVAETRWDKTQVHRRTGQQQKTSGKTTMMFVLEDGVLKIRNLRGNLIYATLSPEIAQASGLSASVVENIRTARDQRDVVPSVPGAAEDPPGVPGAPAPPAGSQVQSGTFSILQNAGHPGMPAWVQEFSFSNYQVHNAPATLDVTYDFRRREGWMEVRSSNGIQDMGSVSIDSVSSVPSSGYGAAVGWMAGHTYAIELSDGTYALVQPTTDPASFPLPFTTHFKYRHQRNGTRVF